MMWLNSLWHFVVSWAGIDMAIGFVAVAIAVLEPKFLDAITDLRKWAICTAVIAFTCTGLLAHGYSNGLAVKQAQWDAALVKETDDGAQILDDARRDGAHDTPDSLRNDSWNRDTWSKRGGN